jgi:hypothetical protein
MRRKFVAGINGATRAETIAGAGHLAYLDQPERWPGRCSAHLA